MRRLAWLAPVAAVVVLGVAPAPAGAFYGFGAAIVSADFQRLEQGDDGSGTPAISQNGRYVAFETRATNFFADDDPDPPGEYRVGGIFRRDMTTGALERVADGDTHLESDNSIVTLGARSPSISADGRYVAFSTAQKLVAQDVNGNVDVYVRDMTKAPNAAGAYTLVSAKDGGDTPAAYGSLSQHIAGGDPGADVWPGAALSADGRRVAFITVVVDSDLPNQGSTTTPGYNLFVRDLDAKTTTLVTRDRTTGNPAGNAFGPATISGDGTTVAWAGQNAPAQTRFLTGESQASSTTFYLWRRLADGPAAPTRRITGEVDLDDPACPPNGSIQSNGTLTGPCYGPLTSGEEGVGAISGRLPSLSSDGYTVAFLTSAGPRPNLATGTGLDAWVTDMHPGVSRKAGSRELTREGGDNTSNGQIESVTVAPNGRRIALVTSRAHFALPSPAPIGAFRPFSDARDLYVIDLDQNTIERATRSFGGGDTDGDSSSPSLSVDGSTIAFSSAAGNLFFGDANERPDVFLVSRQPEPGGGGLPDEPPPSSTPDTLGGQSDLSTGDAPAFVRVSPKHLKDGRVTLIVNAPGAGSFDAIAKSKFSVRVRGRRRTVLRQVSRTRKRVGRAERLQLVLVPGRAYRAQTRTRKGLATTVKVTFKPSRGKTVTASVRAVFLASKS